MADPIPPTPDEIAAQTAALEKVADAQKAYNKTQLDYSDIVTQSSKILDDFRAKLNTAGTDLNSLGKMASDNTGIFLGLGTSIIKAQDTLSGFGTIDMKGLNTFSGHVDDLGRMLLSSGTAGAAARAELERLKGSFLSMGGSPKVLAEATAAGSNAVLSLIKNMFANADRALATQTAFIQLSAATGNLGTAFDKAGHNMEQMNVLLDMQNDLMDQAKAATGSNITQIQDYYAALARVPKAMESVISSGDGVGGTMSMLTATIKLAQGTGRDFNKVVDDLHKSFRDYGLAGQDALVFTARLSELSNKFGVELDDMRSGLLGATDSFKTLTNAGEAAHRMTEGVSGMMSDYIQKLKDSGMTGQHAVEVVRNVTDAMAGLTVAQKAFVSAQAGGPGGLMGAFQIDQMLREGDIEGVQRKVMETMQKQFGRIVTLNEATQSQGAAAQLEKQILMLRQGPLGGLVKTDQDAFRFLETMRAQQEGKPAPAGAAGLDPRGLQTAIDKGTTIEQKSDNKLAQISTDLSSIRHRLETLSLGTIQRAITGAALPQASATSPLGAPLTDIQRQVKEDLASHMRQATQKSGQDAEILKAEMQQKGQLRTDQTKQNIQENVNNLTRDVASAPATLGSGLDTIRQMGRPSAANPEPSSEIQSILDESRQRKAFQDAQKSTARTARPVPMSPGATIAAAPRMSPTAAPGNTPATGTPNVTVYEDGTGGRLNVKVTVSVQDSGGQGQSVTPVSTP